MINFVKTLLSNRFGIVLATINVCLVAYYLTEVPVFTSVIEPLVICINIPAGILSAIVYSISRLLFYSVSDSASVQVRFFFVAFFVVLQWLLIAHLARTIAQKFSRTES